jgi:hypothetical protein
VNIPAIPDYISPIVGYRVWNWDCKRLWSLNGRFWLPGRALAAGCCVALRTDHKPPADGCSCGVYAAKSYQHLQEIYPSGFVEGFAVVQGEVCLWGKVVEHALGYRAQFAYPKSLVLPSNIDPRLESSRLESLMVYGADISIPPNILLWTKGSGYTSAGFDWLAERRKPWCERCKKWHGRILKILQLGDSVMVLGRGIGLVERDDGYSGCTSDSVCVRLGNNDLFIVPFDDMVWDCQSSRWEVDLSGYEGAVILPSSKGWKVLCRPLELKCADKMSVLEVGNSTQEASREVEQGLADGSEEKKVQEESSQEGWQDGIHSVEQTLMSNYSDADKIEAQYKLYRAWEYLDRRNRRKLSSEFAEADADAQSIINAARQTLFRTFSLELREELMYRSLPRGEDR